MLKFIIVITVFVILYVSDRFFLWLERKGWLYYRHKKAPGGVIGGALLQLQSFFIPSASNIIEMKQNQAQFKRSESDAPGDVKK